VAHRATSSEQLSTRVPSSRVITAGSATKDRADIARGSETDRQRLSHGDPVKDEMAEGCEHGSVSGWIAGVRDDILANRDVSAAQKEGLKQSLLAQSVVLAEMKERLKLSLLAQSYIPAERTEELRQSLLEQSDVPEERMEELSQSLLIQSDMSVKQKEELKRSFLADAEMPAERKAEPKLSFLANAKTPAESKKEAGRGWPRPEDEIDWSDDELGNPKSPPSAPSPGLDAEETLPAFVCG
jgi:hypothetical protein